MRILVIDNEPGITTLLHEGLHTSGYEVDVARNGGHGLECATTKPYDAIVLDVQLPDIDGMEVLTRLRDDGLPVPVILLTAHDTVDERVNGLDRGADDFLAKPFAISELLARLRSLLRRPPLQEPNTLVVGNLRLDLARHEASRGERRIDLSLREWNLLEYLMRHAGQVLTRTQIAHDVWDHGVASDSNIVDVYIGYVRRKINVPGSLPLIQTVWGIGYRMDIRA